MGTTNKVICATDNVFASVMVNGRTVKNINRSNFTSVEDVVRMVCTLGIKAMGLVNVTIRNQTQGWIMQVPLLLQRLTAIA